MMRLHNRELLDRLMHESGYNLSSLARRVRLAKSFVSDVTRDRKRIDEDDAAFIALVLGVPVTDLFEQTSTRGRYHASRQRGDAAKTESQATA
jgi:transcriptional regulator with XRE-family HTH domain